MHLDSMTNARARTAFRVHACNKRLFSLDRSIEPVCTENLNSDVTVMESAKDRVKAYFSCVMDDDGG